MEKRDFLVEEIRKIAKLIAAIMKFEIADTIAINKEIYDTLGISTTDLEQLAQEELNQILMDKLKSSENIDTFAEVFIKIGDYDKALKILKAAEQNATNFSLERMMRINDIKSNLN